MTEPLTSNAVIYALLALNSEITLQKDYLESTEIPHEDRDNEEEILNDLEQAFMEFVDLYKNNYLKYDKSLPTIEELLHSHL